MIIDGLKYGGAVDGVSESTWVMGSTVDAASLKKPRHTFFDWKKKESQYNQDKSVHDNGCTIAASAGAVSDQFGVRFTDPDFAEMLDEAENGERYKDRPFSRAEGRRLELAVDLVRRFTSERYIPISSMSVAMLDNGFDIAADLGYSIITGYKGNAAYNRDKNKDCVLDDPQYGASTYSHAVRTVKSKSTGKQHIVDNYVGVKNKCNVYVNEHLQKMQENNQLFRWGFLFFEKYEMPTTPQLPDHIRRDQVSTEDERNIIIAWENEVSERLNNGGDASKLYLDYTQGKAIERMMIDLKLIRLNLM